MSKTTNSAKADGVAGSPVSSSDFQTLFLAAPSPYLVINPRDFTIVAVNDAYLSATMTTREGILGRPLFEVFPGNPNDPAGDDGPRQLLASLQCVVAERRMHQMALTKYDIPRPAAQGGGFEERWWSPQNAPVFGPAGELAFIIHHVEDVTDHMRAEAALRETEEKYRTLFDSIDEGFTTIEVLFDENDRAIDYRFLQVNPSFERQTGIANAAGRRMREIAPLHEEHWFEIYGRVALTGEPVRFINEAAQLGFWYDVYAFRVDDPQLRRVGILFNDITERRRTEQALLETEARMRRAISVPKVGVLFFDLAGHMKEANEAFQQMCGYTIEELRSTTHWVQLTAPEFHELTSHRARDLAENGQTPPYEKEMIRKDGMRWWGLFAPTRLSGSGPQSECVEFVIDITETKRAQEALRLSEERLRGLNEQLEERVRERTLELAEANVSLKEEVRERATAEARVRDLLRQLVNVQEEERRRISRELHDQFGQELSTLSLRLSMLKRNGDGHREQLESMETVVRQLDSRLEFIVRELRPTALDELGLLHALDDYVTNWSQHFNIAARLHARGVDNEPLPGEVETVLYRVTQEALTNVAKHAQANGVDVIFERNTDHVSLIVEDDGVGFDTDSTDGLGLTGMRERAVLVGGSVILESNAGKGTTVFVRVPTSRVAEGDGRDG